MNIGVIIASNRPVRNGGQIADWVKEHTNKDKEVNYTYFDLAEENLPFLDEPQSPMMGNYQNKHTIAWGKKIAAQDGFLIVIPEYNHGYPAVLKNALDTLFAEWNKKPVSFVGYGVMGAARSIEHIAGALLQLKMVPFTNTYITTNILLFQSLDKDGKFKPAENDETALQNTLGNLKKWTLVLKDNREKL